MYLLLTPLRLFRHDHVGDCSSWQSSIYIVQSGRKLSDNVPIDSSKGHGIKRLGVSDLQSSLVVKTHRQGCAASLFIFSYDDAMVYLLT